jgi:hypothetical protein
MKVDIAFLLFFALFSSVIDTEYLFYLSMLNSLICIYTLLQHKKVIITPIVVFCFGVILTNIANMILISRIGVTDFKMYSYVVPKFINEATQIWCISANLMIIGYKSFQNKSFASLYYDIKNIDYIKFLFYILMIFNVMSLFVPNLAFRGSILKFFGLLNSIGILFFARLWGQNDNKTYRSYAFLLFVVETYIALTTSYLRLSLIMPAIYLFSGYFIGKKDIKYIFSYRAIPLIVLIYLFSSVFSELQDNRTSFISVFSAKEEDFTRHEKGPSNGSLLDRCANLAQITNVVKLTKQNGFYDGKASAPLVVALIPRFLWHDKPAIALGAWFALEIGAAYKNESGNINNSVNMTIPGELYLDFGWLGVVVGSFLVGAFMVLLWNSTHFYSSELNLIGTIFGGYVLYVSLLGFGADLQIAITLLSTYLFFLVVKRLLNSL